MINRLNLGKRVTIIKPLKNPFQLIKQFDLFVQASRWESFGNALVEAMSLGLPVISFDSYGAASEIIKNYEDGILVPKTDIEKNDKTNWCTSHRR